MQVAYSQGAAGYVIRATNPWVMYNGNNAGFALTNDGVYVGASDVELTTVWGINGFYQHFWNPKWRSSLYAGYVETGLGAGAFVVAGVGDDEVIACSKQRVEQQLAILAARIALADVWLLEHQVVAVPR